jgi:serine/threonine-protein kinase
MNNNNLENAKLGKFEIRAEIGRGGMGIVYRGYDPLLERHVAIKVLAPHLVWENEFVERFLREARSAARLRHPNIVTIYDVGHEAGWYYFVMEFVEGQTLTDLIRQRGPLPATDALAILLPLAQALDYAHQRGGLVHRDIKPSNIIMTPDGQVVLTDFGIAQAAQETRLTATGSIVGTPEYMAPEQARGLGVDGRTDQYSLAVVAYELLSGKVPFQADTTLALLFKITQEPPPSISQMRPDLPKGMESVLNAALAKNPADRYPTVTAFIETLGRAIAGRPVPATGPTAGAARAAPQAMATAAVPPQTRVPIWRRVPAWGWVLSALAIVALVVGGWQVSSANSAAKADPSPQPTKVAAATATLTHTPRPSHTPDVASTDAASTVVAAALTVSAPTSTRTASATPAATATPAPTRTPTETPTRKPKWTATKTATPLPSPTPKSTATSPPKATFTPGAATATPKAPTITPAPAASGTLFTFEQMGPWHRGDQPYGDLTQIDKEAHTGNYSARLRYDFPATDQDFVVFVNPTSLAGQPDTVGAWVYGDGSGHYLNVWLQDAQNQIWSVHLGKVAGSGWRQMVGKLDPSLGWPAGHVSGPDDGVVDYPVRFYALVLDRPGSGPQKGRIFIDDVSVWKNQ